MLNFVCMMLARYVGVNLSAHAACCDHGTLYRKTRPTLTSWEFLFLPLIELTLWLMELNATTGWEDRQVDRVVQRTWVGVTKVLKCILILPCVLPILLVNGLCLLCYRQHIVEGNFVPPEKRLKLFFGVYHALAAVLFWVDVVIESVFSPFQCLWFFVVSVCRQTTVLPKSVKIASLMAYGLCVLVIASAVLSFSGVLTPLLPLPIGILSLTAACIKLVGYPTANLLFAVSGLYLCAALAYLGRVYLSRMLLITTIEEKWAVFTDHTAFDGCILQNADQSINIIRRQTNVREIAFFNWDASDHLLWSPPFLDTRCTQRDQMLVTVVNDDSVQNDDTLFVC